MFEAHYISSTDFNISLSIPLPKNTFYRLHQPSLKPLRIWFAAGKSAKYSASAMKLVFIYSEYINKHGLPAVVCQCQPYPDNLKSKDIAKFLAIASKQKINDI